jgi:glycogen operon protein
MEIQDICWYRPDGEQMTEDEWTAGWVRCLGMRLSGKTLSDTDRFGEPVRDDTFLVCLNPHHEGIEFYMPAFSSKSQWELIIDTRNPVSTPAQNVKIGEAYSMMPHSAVLFREVQKVEEAPKEPQTVTHAVETDGKRSSVKRAPAKRSRVLQPSK